MKMLHGSCLVFALGIVTSDLGLYAEIVGWSPHAGSAWTVIHLIQC